MKPTLLPLLEQTIVIAGASSGIGLVTARAAARRGARVVVAGSHPADLRRIVDEIRREGGRALDVVTDVSDGAQVERLANRAVAEFGGIDTWVQIAGGYPDHVTGSRAAVRRMRARGGAVINVRGGRADHALEAFTNTLRTEMEEEGVPISVTLVKLSSDAILEAATRPSRQATASGAGVSLALAAIAVAVGAAVAVVAGSSDRRT